MNVKQGDIAIQIISAAGNEGKIVEVLEYMGLAPVWYKGRICEQSYTGPVWLCKYQRPTKRTCGNIWSVAPIADSNLVPVSGLEDSFEEENEKELENV